jgi:hypothetical protein
VTTDRYRPLTAAAVLLVAAIAAVVNYTHICLLDRYQSRRGRAASLLPLAVIGLIPAVS